MKGIKNYCGIVLLMMLFFFTACSVSKEARTMKNTINGYWILQTIRIEGTDAKLKANVFNEADYSCFTGSSWNFISNNGMGNYTLPGTAPACSSLVRNIRWTIDEPKDGERKFQFKRLDENKNPMDDNNGYRLSVASLTDNTMQLKSAISFEGKPVNIVYNFVKK